MLSGYDHGLLRILLTFTMIPTHLTLDIPDVGVFPPDALEVGEFQLEAGQARGEHRVGLCNLE